MKFSNIRLHRRRHFYSLILRRCFESEAEASNRMMNLRSSSSRMAGVLVPIFAIRYADDLGIGDVRGARLMIDWLADIGMGFLQVLPINETGRDNSPYNAISSVALEPALLDVSPHELADLEASEYEDIVGQVDLTLLRVGDVKYEKVKRLKLDVLWKAFDRFWRNHYGTDSSRDQGFHRFCASEQGWLGDYCLFRLLMDMEGGSEDWQSWNEEYRDVMKARSFVDALLEVKLGETEKQLGFYAYVQWIAFEQWKNLRDYADRKGVSLMGDIPFGISYCSSDVFCEPDIFDLKWSGGAPPEKVFKSDAFTEKWGQNWGIPLYRWERAAETDYSWWRRRVAKVCEIFSLFRLDHALGFYRIYAFPWRPNENDMFLPLSLEEAREKAGGNLPGFRASDDDSEEKCQANRESGERHLRIIRDEAHSARIVAEDLGVVPQYVEPSLSAIGIAGMKVPHWEAREDGSVLRGEDYPELSLATYATHDHEPLRSQWNHWCALIRSGDTSDAARQSITRLCEFSGIDKRAMESKYSDTIREALLSALFSSNSEYVSVMITDLLGLEDRFNTPGSVESGNWTVRMEEDVIELSQDVHWRFVGARIRGMLGATDRETAVRNYGGTD